MRQKFDQIITWGVDHRWLTILFVVLLSIVSGLGHYDEQILLNLIKKAKAAMVVVKEDEKKNQKAKTDPEKKEKKKKEVEVPRVNPLRLDRCDAIIAIESDHLFTAEGIAALRKAVSDLEAREDVWSVIWMDNVPSLNIFDLSESLLPRSKAPPAVLNAAQKTALDHPLVGGQLLSRDARTTMFLVWMDWRYNFHNEQILEELRESMEVSLAEFPETSFEFWVTGELPGTVTSIALHENNQMKFQIIGYGMILVMALLLFRGLRPVIIVTLAPAFGAFWAMGIIAYIDYDRNGLVDIVVPVLIAVIALTDAVHLMIQIRRYRASGLTAAEAARQGLLKVGLACFLTSLTTAIGFGSLLLADAAIVSDFGKCSVVGVSLSFLAVILITPLACSSWLGKSLHLGQDTGIVDKNLAKIRPFIGWITERPTFFSFIAILSTVALIAFSAFHLRPDYQIAPGMPKDAEVTKGFHHLEKAFDGIEFATVAISWNEKIDSQSPEVLTLVRKVDELLQSQEMIAQPLSIYNLLQALPGNAASGDSMPLLELLPPPLKRAFYGPEIREASVQFRIRDVGIAVYGPIFLKIQEGLREIEKDHPNAKMELRGTAIWRWKELFQVVVDLAKGLGVASVIIFVVLSLVFRSIRIGLISLVPNFFPLAMSSAFLVVAGFNLEITMVCSFTVCLGIAVDDSVHFLTRFYDEKRKGGEIDQVIRNAFTGVGTALIATTIILVAGFLTLLASESRDHQIFAKMGAIAIASALFADLVFLPAMLKRFAPKE